MFDWNKYLPINFLRNICLIEKNVKRSWYFLDFRSDSEQDPDPDKLNEPATLLNTDVV